MFQCYGIKTRFRYLTDKGHQPLHSINSTFKITGLQEYRGCKIYLKLCKFDSEAKHEFAQLHIFKNKENFESSEDIIKGLIESDEINLDFVTIIKNLGCRKCDDTFDKITARIQLQILLTNGSSREDISKIIRHVDSNIGTNVKLLGFAFPKSINDNKKNISILFDKEIPYFPQEIALFNGSEIIYPDNGDNYPINNIQFDLAKLSDCSNLTLQFKPFNISTRILANDLITKMYPQLNQYNTITEPQESELLPRQNKNFPSSSIISNSFHFKEFGTLLRYRYDNEIDNKNKSPLHMIIKNLSQFKGSKMVLELVKWKDGGQNSALDFYFIQTKCGFNLNSKSISTIIQYDQLNLDFLGIKKNKRYRGFDGCNCRIKMAVNGTIAFSNVIRNLKSKCTSDLKIEEIYFPANPKNYEIIIHLKEKVSYSHHEFVLQKGVETITSDISMTDNGCFQNIAFDLKLFSNPMSADIYLNCKTFNINETVPTDAIKQIYPQLLFQESNYFTEYSQQTAGQIEISSSSSVLGDVGLIYPNFRAFVKRNHPEKYIPKTFTGIQTEPPTNTQTPFKKSKNETFHTDYEYQKDKLSLGFSLHDDLLKSEPDYSSVFSEIASYKFPE